MAAFAFDHDGRLWLTAAGLESHPHDGIYLISHPGAPARLVVSGLIDPLGLAWFRGELYVASVGRVDAYWDFDGARFARHRRVLDGPVRSGENNELVSTSDGGFLMGVSASCDHCRPSSKWSGAIVSFRPDGRALQVYASAIRAPTGLAYMPGTNELFVTMNEQDNLGPATPGDLLAEVERGEEWRFPTCHGGTGAGCQGVPPPVAVLDKHAAAGGIAFPLGQLQMRLGVSVVVAEWSSRKVLGVALTRNGRRYTGTPKQILAGIESPFALTTAPDGSLLVGDWATGRIYQIEA